MLFYLLHGISFDISILEMMLANMSKNQLFPLRPHQILALLPVLLHIFCDDKEFVGRVEPLMCIVLIAASVILFYWHILMLTLQYYARNPDQGIIFLTDKQMKAYNN